jgi:hypothetical protein
MVLSTSVGVVGIIGEARILRIMRAHSRDPCHL